MKIAEKIKSVRMSDRIAFFVTCCISIISAVDVVRYAVLGNPVAFVTMLVVNLLFILCALTAGMGRVHPLYLVVAVFGFILFGLTNNIGTTVFNITFMFQAIVSTLGGIVGTIFCIKEKLFPKKIFAVFSAIILVIVVFFIALWGTNINISDNTTEFKQEFWSVPDIYETDVPEKGRVEKLNYTTKSYAVDGRSVQKSAYVYIPYGYDEAAQYEILYLLHGTGDDETSWLIEHMENKMMLDNLIYNHKINPLIVVTPTFYVEN
ncbi:MAG: hypothetical protein IJX05_00135, partial [Clostridia bacterium]|nr:hypothetical protein [Clostridia bacterium]